MRENLSGNTKKTAVLIPCYNEGKTIGKVVSDFKKALPEADVWVYDNGSEDDTLRNAIEAGALTGREYKKGKGNVVRRMLREIDADCYILADGDDTYDASDAGEMARLVLEEGADMVIGDRLSSTYFQENNRLLHGFGNVLVRSAVNAAFRTDVKDVMTGYRAMSRLFAKTLPVLSEGFELETEMTIHAADKNMRIVNYKTAYRSRPEGSASKLHTIRDGSKVLASAIRIFKDYRPLAFFGGIAAALLFLALAFFLPVLNDYIATGSVDRFPTLIVCCFTAAAGLQSFFAGLILQSLRRKDRSDFERELNRWQR